MSVLRIEIVEVSETKTAGVTVEPRKGARDALIVVRCSAPGRDTLATVDVLDLAKAACRNARSLEQVENAWSWRRNCVVSPARRSHETT